MLIRTAALAVAIAGCLDAPEPPLAEHQDSIICGALCDPEYASLLDDAYQYGFRLFPDAGTLREGCANLGTGWDCVVTLAVDRSPCGSVVVECLAQQGRPPRCSWTAPDGCD